MAEGKMRIALGDKEFAYFGRTDFADQPTAVLVAKMQNSGPMTRHCVIAELARREGAEVVRRR